MGNLPFAPVPPLAVEDELTLIFVDLEDALSVMESCLWDLESIFSEMRRGQARA